MSTVADQECSRHTLKWHVLRVDHIVTCDGWDTDRLQRQVRRRARRQRLDTGYGDRRVVYLHRQADKFLSVGRKEGIYRLVFQRPGNRLHVMTDMVADKEALLVRRLNHVLSCDEPIVLTRQPRIGRAELFFGLYRDAIAALSAALLRLGWSWLPYDSRRGDKRSVYRQNDIAVFEGRLAVGDRGLKVRIAVYSYPDWWDPEFPTVKVELKWHEGRLDRFVEQDALERAFVALMQHLTGMVDAPPVDVSEWRGSTARTRTAPFAPLALELALRDGAVSAQRLSGEFELRGLTAPSRPGRVLKRLAAKGDLVREGPSFGPHLYVPSERLLMAVG